MRTALLEHPVTDRSEALEQREYVWDTHGETEIHQFVDRPIVARLRAADAHYVLDLGCGNGAFSARLARHGFEVEGIDQSQSGVGIAARMHPGLSFTRHDLSTLLPPVWHGSFDAVVSVEVIEHMLLPRMLIRNAMLALRPGGVLIVTTPYHGYVKNLALALAGGFDSHWHPLRDFGHVKFFSLATLTELFREHGLEQLHHTRVGRIPMLARSMILSGRKPLANK